jgi:hypothetical protein
MKNKPAYLLIAGSIFVIVVVFAVFSHRPVCPDDYATTDQATVAMNAWTNSYYDSHPGASLGDWARARHQFYVDNHCTAALQRYDEAKAGKADPATMESINSALEEATR